MIVTPFGRLFSSTQSRFFQHLVQTLLPVVSTPFFVGNIRGSRTNHEVSVDGLNEVLKKAALSVKSLPKGVTITSFRKFGERNNPEFTVTISGDVETATDGMRKYL